MAIFYTYNKKAGHIDYSSIIKYLNFQVLKRDQGIQYNVSSENKINTSGILMAILK